MKPEDMAAGSAPIHATCGIGICCLDTPSASSEPMDDNSSVCQPCQPEGCRPSVAIRLWEWYSDMILQEEKWPRLAFTTSIGLTVSSVDGMEQFSAFYI